jgi:translation initiation factor 1A
MPSSKKNKSKKNSKSKGNGQVRNQIVYKVEGQAYGKVIRKLGGTHLECLCDDGVTRRVTIRGQMMRRVWISGGDVVLLGLRDYQEDKADVVHKYSQEDVRQLTEFNLLPAALVGRDENAEDDEFGFGYDSDDSGDDDEIAAQPDRPELGSASESEDSEEDDPERARQREEERALAAEEQRQREQQEEELVRQMNIKKAREAEERAGDSDESESDDEFGFGGGKKEKKGKGKKKKQARGVMLDNTELFAGGGTDLPTDVGQTSSWSRGGDRGGGGYRGGGGGYGDRDGGSRFDRGGPSTSGDWRR